jgi:RsiW-degrading membrane proteinase PrsW (M82 family)
LRKPWLWAVFVSSAFLTLAAVSFIQIPLQALTWRALAHFLGVGVLARWILLTGIPQILLTGLVQEGSKLVPVIVYWRRSGKNIDPKLGLAIGAVAGAGFGILQWGLNARFASGWGWEATWEVVQIGGFMALLSFWGRFFAVAAHIAFSALAGYGLAKGWGWQFYLIASVLHGLLDYRVVLLPGLLRWPVHVEIYAVVLAALVTAWVLWLRWRRTPVMPEPEPVVISAP